MRRRGHADGNCVQVQGARPACIQTRLGGAEDREVALLAQRLRRDRIGVGNRSQPHPDPGLIQLAINAQMIAPKGARAEDGDVESVFTSHLHW